MSILDVFDNFYEVVEPAKENVPEIGHLWFTPVLFTEETPRIFQAQRADPCEHEITSFEIVHANSRGLHQLRGRFSLRTQHFNS